MHSDVLAQLYVRYYQSAYLYTLSLCNNRELAEDFVADAFVKAYLTLSDEHNSYQYWLMRVCKNLWIDYLRRQKRNADIDDDTLSEIPDTYTPEQRFLANERLSVLYRCIRSLREPDREILILHYFSKLPLRDIAQLMQATPGSIKTRIFRARLSLKQLMEDNGYEL